MPGFEKYTLVVVDMQPTFEASTKIKVIVGVTQEIIEAVQANLHVVLLEYEDCGATHRPLAELLSGYKRKSRVVKIRDDGSYEVLAVIRRRGFYGRRLRVCGVNTNCCVAATVKGLVQLDPDIKIEVSKRGCDWSQNYDFDWRTYPRHKNVKLV